MAYDGMENLKPSKVYICVNILHNQMKALMVEKEMNEVFSISYNFDGSRYCCIWAKKIWSPVNFLSNTFLNRKIWLQTS